MRRLRQRPLLPPWRRLLLGVLVAAAGALIPIVASFAGEPTIEATTGTYGYFHWSPSTATVAEGGGVAFANASAEIPHGVEWTGGPGTPSCAGVPIDEGKTSWKGSCTFAQPGTYTFRCYVHPTEMTGSITVTAAGTTTTTTTTTTPESPLAGPPAEALIAPSPQRGRVVHGSIALSAAATGAQLEFGLLASRRSLGERGHGRVAVGTLLRTATAAGRLRFAVRLDQAARRALSLRRKLALTLSVIISPAQGEALRISRRVVVRL